MSAALNNWHGRMSEDDAQDSREERIADRAAEIAKRLIVDVEACRLAASEIYGDPVESIMQDVGTFYALFEAAQTDADMASAGYDLWRVLKPYMQHAAKMQAKSDARDEIEAEEAAHRDDAIQAKAA
jgi:hypothetical protein